LVSFRNTSLCKHEILFPLDATYGDKININITKLNCTEAALGIGQNYESDLDVYNFNNSVSQDNPGFLQLVYPLRGYLVLTYNNYTKPRPP